MKKLFLLLAFVSFFSYSNTIVLSQRNIAKIAHKIWLNEGAGKTKYLVWWNRGEEFASCGIGHFIWFTKEKPMWFYHAFPHMLAFIIKKGAKPPRWLTPKTPNVWSSYAQWKRAKQINSKKMQELTNFLNSTKSLQAQFMVHRLQVTYPKLLAYAKTTKEKEKIAKNFHRLLYKKDGSIDAQGAYCLIDYTNFKGSGTLESERYQNTGWGLFQVLGHMDSKNPDKFAAFANSVRFILDRLIQVSPPKRNLKRFRAGWFSRVKTYESF